MPLKIASLCLAGALCVVGTTIGAQTNTFPSSGNAGIGTTSPDQNLTLNSSSGVNSLISFKQNGTTAAYVGLGTDAVFRNQTQSGTELQIRAEGASNFISLYTNSSEKARLIASGNLGIGVTNPWAKLDVRTPGANAGDQYALNLQNPSSAAYATVNLTLSSGSSSFSTVGAQRNNSGSGSTLFFQTSDNTGGIQPRMYINEAGNVGIGAQNYVSKLTVTSTSTADGVWVSGTGTTNVALLNNMTPGAWNSITQTGDNMIMWKGSGIDNSDAGGLVLGPWSNYATGIRIAPTGNVGIGVANPGTYKLAVEGTMGARKVKVTQASWSDFVFEKNYQLPSLKEVEEFIHTNKHLPGIPTTKEVEKNGLDVGDTQALLLQKIEELTLYIIQQQKEIDELKAKL
jgi:hypothetical protein